jgi:hypothetical protein
LLTDGQAVRLICQMEIMAMKTRQAWVWLAAGVLALGLNGFYQDGGAVWAHRIVNGAVGQVAERSRVLVDLARERVDGFVESANLVAVRDDAASCRLGAAMAQLQAGIGRAQSGVAHFEALSAREEVARARVEASRAGIEARVARVRMVPVVFNAVEVPGVVCSRVRVNIPRVRVPRLPVVKVPVVHVEVGAGPA